MPNSKHIKGDRAELIAAEYFIGLGYSVARNMSQHGPVDLVLIDEEGTGDVILVDVKAVSIRTKNGWKICRALTKKQKELDVQLIFVDLNTREVLDIVPTKQDRQTKVKETDMTNVVNLRKFADNIWFGKEK